MVNFWIYLITFTVFIVIDLIWLGVIGQGIYQKYLGHLLKKDVNWIAAIIFYLLFILGLLVFVVGPAYQNGDILEAFLMGGLLGLIMYATYDLTNLATLKDWPLPITLIDLMWGTFLGSLTSGVAVILSLWIFS
jgi:uncharacterized membrane protein